MIMKRTTDELRTESRAAYNSTFAIGGVSCSEDSFVVKESSVLRMNICTENPPIANLQTVMHYTMSDLTKKPTDDYLSITSFLK
jgi:hypothetical protein